MKNINRFMAVFLLALLFVSGIPGNLQKKSGFLLEAKAGCGTRESAVQWVLSQEGKRIDYDGAYGCQCVDLIKAYYAHFGVAQYARGNGNQYASNALPPGWTRIRNYAEFVPEPGDVAVWGTGIGRNGHVAIILSANVNRFTSMDQNWPSGSGCKKVNHNYRHFWGVVRPNFDTVTTPSNNTKVVNQTAKTPSIQNVKIDSIDADHVSFRFAAQNAEMAKVIMKSKDTGESRTLEFTSNLGDTYYTFDTFSMPGTTALNITIYAYSDRKGSNPVEHKMTYGSEIGVVDLLADGPKGAEKFLFDARFYADRNTDIRKVYGYDEKKLYRHWRQFGLYEGRVSSPIYNPDWYILRNSDVRQAFGKDYVKVYLQFISYGFKEYRESSEYYCGMGYQSRYYGEFKDMDSEKLMEHFKNYGLKEGRQAGESVYSGNSSWK